MRGGAGVSYNILFILIKTLLQRSHDGSFWMLIIQNVPGDGVERIIQLTL